MLKGKLTETFGKRLPIYLMDTQVAGRLCLVLGAILLVYCLYYLVRGNWPVAAGGLITGGSLLLMGGLFALHGKHSGLVTVLSSIVAINVGAVVAMTSLGPLGIVWYGPLVLVNILFAGTLLGAILTVISVSSIFMLGGFYIDVDFAVNIAGALLLSFCMAFAYSVTRRTRELHLRGEADRDPLTGAMNRRGLDLSIRRLLEGSDEHWPFSAVMLDLDHFKTINDRYGHQAGDAVLQRFVRILEDRLRKQDEIYRYGGEEFMLLIEADEATAANVAEEIRATVERELFLDDSNVTVSAGISQAQRGDTVEAVLERADSALYRAKSEGRNCCRMAIKR